MKATTRRAAIPAAEDYDSEEPNVRLSRAFIVVMLLHVVAVGGIFAFSSLKKNHAEPNAAMVENATESVGDLPAGSTIHTVRPDDTLGAIAATYGVTRSDLETANRLKDSAQIQTGDRLIIPAKSAAQPVSLDVQKLLQLSQQNQTAPAPVKAAAPVPVKAATPVSNKAAEPAAPKVVETIGAKTYIVAKGDNPVSIAKRHGINYVDLLKANHITDPKKLQIGQKLVIPGK